jgi:hypothetical protein
MSEGEFWALIAVHAVWMALNVWHTAQNWRMADDNLRQARETATLIEQARWAARP